MALYESFYPKLQDHLLSLRRVMKNRDARITQVRVRWHFFTYKVV